MTEELNVKEFCGAEKMCVFVQEGYFPKSEKMKRPT